MSRVLVPRKTSASRNKSSTSLQYKMFIWDLGTDYKEAHKATIRTMAVVEYSSAAHELAHFSTAIRSPDMKTNRTTPTLVEAWDDFTNFIADHSEGKQPLLVSHNAGFDVTVLLAEVRRNRIKIPSYWRFACSLLFARSVSSGTENSQSALAARLGIRVSHPHKTSEDVIILSRILRALDDKAAKDKDSVHRVIPAICSQARTPPFFDKTPQHDSGSHPSTKPKLYIANTGTKYHREGCQWLRISKIPRDTPPPGFEPCKTCRPSGDRRVMEKPRTSADGAAGAIANAERKASSSVARSPGTTRLFVTRRGEKYHVEGCRYLKSQIPVDSPPPGFKPCSTCIQDKRPKARSPSAEDYVGESSSSCSSEEAQYFVTKSGTMYHKKGCSNLRDSCIPKRKGHVGYGPCGVCLPHQAYRGTPKLRLLKNP